MFCVAWLVVSLTVACTAKEYDYVTVLREGYAYGWLKDLGEWIIPDQQCSGQLLYGDDENFECDPYGILKTVRVEAGDNDISPKVAIHDNLRTVNVFRVNGCEGEASINLRISCRLIDAGAAAGKRLPRDIRPKFSRNIRRFAKPIPNINY